MIDSDQVSVETIMDTYRTQFRVLVDFLESLTWSQFVVLLLLGVTVVFGSFIRLLPLLEAGVHPRYPIEGGGLYLAFVDAIQSNSFGYPILIDHYTQGGIPFAYPPLLFYVIAAVDFVVPVSVYSLTQALPFIFAALTVPAMAVVAFRLFDSSSALVATVVYALAPEAFEPLVVGEGLVEAAVTLVFILSLLPLYRLATGPSTDRDGVFVGVIVGVAAMLGPGGLAGVPVAALCIVATCVRSRERFRVFVIAGVVSVFVSGIWWVPVMIRHGVGVFLNAVGTKTSAGSTLETLTRAAGFEFTVLANSHLDVLSITLFVVLGALYCAVVLPRFFSFVLMIPLFSILGEPNYLSWVALSILVGIGATQALPDLLAPWFEEASGTLVSTVPPDTLFSLLTTVLAVILILQPAMTTADFVYPPSYAQTKEDAQVAFEWLRTHSDQDARVLVITSDPWLLDWAPIWANRTVINVFQGTEWIGEHDRRRRLNRRLEDAASPGVVREQLEDEGLADEYEYVVLTDPTGDDSLVANYSTASGCEVVFRNANTLVCHRFDSGS